MLPGCGTGEALVGVVVAVPEPLASRLRAVRAAAGDPEADIPPHVTLVGPTCVPDVRAVDAHLSRVAGAHRPFGVHLRGTGTFRPVSPVVFVALADGADACAALEADLRSGPLDVPARFPFHPHVTVAHDVGDGALDAAQAAAGDVDVRFEVDRLFRFVHDGTAWQPVRTFLLGTGEPVLCPDAPPEDAVPGAPHGVSAADAPAGAGAVVPGMPPR
ncbi:2'-5' RNA ligase family protein [Cellulomonas oligotrophica]|nr:2'-5' RNA ligase family protein [Cellulomonas oligotrophica]GIG33438.1 phosphoesterase [Cellulomonas oligotrophica]